jgi:hypothetical protein
MDFNFVKTVGIFPFLPPGFPILMTGMRRGSCVVSDVYLGLVPWPDARCRSQVSRARLIRVTVPFIGTEPAEMELDTPPSPVQFGNCYDANRIASENVRLLTA